MEADTPQDKLDSGGFTAEPGACYISSSPPTSSTRLSPELGTSMVNESPSNTHSLDSESKAKLITEGAPFEFVLTVLDDLLRTWLKRQLRDRIDEKLLDKINDEPLEDHMNAFAERFKAQLLERHGDADEKEELREAAPVDAGTKKMKAKKKSCTSKKLEVFLNGRQTAITRVASKYYTDVQAPEERHEILRDNGHISETFGEKIAVKSTYFIFVRTLNEGPERVRLLVTEYNKKRSHGQYKSLGDKALDVSRQVSNRHVKELFESINLATRWQMEDSVLSQTMRLVCDVNLWKKQEQLVQLVKNRESEFMLLLEEEGLVTRQGVNYQTLVYEYILKLLGYTKKQKEDEQNGTGEEGAITKETFRYLIQRLQPTKIVVRLEEQVGPGILLFLPGNSASLLQPMGIQKLNLLMPRIGKLLAPLKPLFDQYHKEIMIPLVEGTANALPVPVAEDIKAEIEKLLGGVNDAEDEIQSGSSE